MKTRAIPFFAALGCTLTACGDKENEETEDTNTDTEDTDTEDTDTDDTDTDDTGEDENELSELVGMWTVDAMSETYYGETYEMTLPDTYTYTNQSYGAAWVGEQVLSAFLEVAEDGALTFITSTVYTQSFSIDGTEIYSSTYGYSYAEEGGTISFDGGDYILDLDEEVLNCTLTGDSLSCENEIRTADLSRGGEVPENIEEVSASWPATPEYTKEDCVDAEIQGTGNSLEWGGFDDVGNDFATGCYYEEPGFYYGYGYSEDMDDLVFSFEAPNDGCFAFDTTGTNFHHGIHLNVGCPSRAPASSTTQLSCSMTQHLEHGLEAGSEVLVIIDGYSGEEQVFNLSINEIPFDPDSYDLMPEDTSAIDTSAWIEEVETDCGTISSAKTYRFTPSVNGELVINLAGSDFDTIVQIQKAECGAPKQCNDDEAGEEGQEGSPQSFLRTFVNAGHEYLITVGGYDGETGTLSMSLLQPSR